MICAYDKNYLEKAKISMAFMLDYVVYDSHMEMDEFFQLFIESGVARKFEMEIRKRLQVSQELN